MKVHDFLERAARDHPDRTAVVHLDDKFTYRDLYGKYRALAAFLDGLELAPGARVALLWDNSFEYVMAFFAVFRAGYVLVPLDTSVKPDKLADIIADCGAEALLCQSKFRRHLDRILPESTTVRHLISDRALKPGREAIAVGTLADILDNDAYRHDGQLPGAAVTFDPAAARHDLAAIFYTSGSTGTSKGVMLSHRNLVSNTEATVEYLRLTPADSVIVILPFYYIYGNSLLLTHVACGGALVVDNRFMYPEVILDTMERERVTGFSGVPSNFMILLNNSTFTTRTFENLRYFTQAGGAMAPEVIRRLIDAFPDKEICIMYGQTEAAPRATYCPPERLREKLGSIGIPVPGVTIKIMNDRGDELPPGESGEIIVIGDNVMLGYWNQPEEQAQVLRDGRLFTGDLGKMDDDGYFYVIGRKKEIIKCGGNRVSAKEVEERILENEKVSEAAVFGVADPLLGEAIKVAVVLKNGCRSGPKEIQDFCREKLAIHKVPKYVEFLDELPKYQSGKVNKLQLAKR